MHPLSIFYLKIMKLRRTALLVYSFVIGLNVTAQSAVNMKFGKPTKEELQMTTYTEDSTAEAVVLCRLTDVNCQCITGSMNYKLESDPLAAPVNVRTNRYTCVGRNLKGIPRVMNVRNVQKSSR